MNTDCHNTAANSAPLDRAWQALADVMDPEVPALSVVDLGIVRNVDIDQNGGLTVIVTPTYSGCPATDMIRDEIVRALHARGFVPVTVVLSLHPAWSTDWITERGRQRLVDYGIAPPVRCAASEPSSVHILHWQRTSIACPRCESSNTEVLSEFGTTACKALHRCRACGEPFEYFKAH